MPLYALTIFLSAFLLFQVQPMIGKCILPWFGSSPAVWTTCMLFFQLLLLGGYAYAHGLVTWLSRKQQVIVHSLLLLAALALLPITPQAPTTLASDDPTWEILAILALSVGAPYALLASTGPLLQGWFSITHPGRSPYRLYALSNVGSLLALLSYPVVIERFVRLKHQTWIWSGGFALFALLAVVCAIRLWRTSASTGNQLAEGDAENATGEAKPQAAPTWGDVALWLLLPMCGSVMLLAITNQMCQDIAVVPFLWVLPLSLYLLTFIIAFDNERWYHRGVFLPLLYVTGGYVLGALFWGVNAPLWFQILAYPAGVFFTCMPCHGELVRIRPGPRHLTLFYLLISLGGALGGIFVALIAPQLFSGYWELHIGLAATCLVVALAVARHQWRTRYEFESTWTWGERFEPSAAEAPIYAPNAELARELNLGALATATTTTVVAPPAVATPARRPASRLAWLTTWTPGAALAWAALVFGLVWQTIDAHDRALTLERGFFGVLSIEEIHDWRKILDKKGQPTGDYDKSWRRLSLIHGRIMHGYQLQVGEKRFWPTSYYGNISGVGLAIEKNPLRHQPNRQFRLGVVGLGTGTIAAYAQKGEYLRFYDINPHLVELSGRYFTYRDDAVARGADVDIFLGDARMVLEGQLEEGSAQDFDVLAVDAFSGDAIPIHLLTSECIRTYLKHLKPDGILAIHVSNRYLDLKPICRQHAADNGLEALWISASEDDDHAWGQCDWILLTKNKAFIEAAKETPQFEPWNESNRSPLRWTDDFSSVYQILRLE